MLFSEPVTHSLDEHVWPYLCFGLTPSAAWGLSGNMEWTGEIEEWDLWQFNGDRADDLRIRNVGDVIEEVRSYKSISADRLWYVATRDQEFARKKGKLGDHV